MIDRDIDTLEIITALKNRGYAIDFNYELNRDPHYQVSGAIYPNDYTVDFYYRFEGMSDPDDNSILYAISASDGRKGILIDSFGLYAEKMIIPDIRLIPSLRDLIAL